MDAVTKRIASIANASLIAQKAVDVNFDTESITQATASGGRVLLAYADHSNLPSNPGWLLRNALLLAAARWGPNCLLHLLAYP